MISSEFKALSQENPLPADVIITVFHPYSLTLIATLTGRPGGILYARQR